MENTVENMFVEATKNRYRFASSKGELSVEDLWQLSLQSLDEIAITISEELEKLGKRSFIQQKTKTSTELQLKLDVARFVINYKLDEKEKKMVQAAKSRRLAFLKELREKKSIEQMENMSTEELERQIAELEDQD